MESIVALLLLRVFSIAAIFIDRCCQNPAQNLRKNQRCKLVARLDRIVLLVFLAGPARVFPACPTDRYKECHDGQFPQVGC